MNHTTLSQTMDTQILEEIGLTKSEIRVYLALSEIGSSSTGKIIEKSRAASSKIYEVLDKLQQKGLVTVVIQSGVKYFEAAPPSRILDYVREREEQFSQQKEQLQKIIPDLELSQKLSKHQSEAAIFKGIKGVKTAYDDILRTLKKGDEYRVMGATTPSEPFFSFIRHFHQRRATQGIKVKVLYTPSMQQLADAIKELPHTSIKFSPQELLSTAFVIMYANKTLISVATKNDITLFRIESQDVSDSLKAHFELLWNQKSRVLHGFSGIQVCCQEVLQTRKDLYLIGANGLLFDRYQKFFKQFDAERVKRKIKRHHLALERTRNQPINTQPNMQVRYLPKQFGSPLVIWIFGNKVANILWDTEDIYLIENAKIAEDYRKYFNLLWKGAKE